MPVYNSAGCLLVSMVGGAGGDGYNIVSAGTQSGATTGTIVFSNSNNISFGMSNSSVVTATATFAQSNQSLGMYLSSQTTGGASSTTVDARSMTIAGMGNISVGASLGSIVISGSGGGGGGVALSAAGSSQSAGTVVFSNSNNVSFGMAGSTVTGTATFAQSVQAGSVYASSNTFGTSSGTYDARTLSIAGSGLVSIAASNSGWVVNVPAARSLYAASNTFGTSSGTYDDRTLSIAGSGAASIAASNSGWVVSVPAGASATGNLGAISAAAGSVSAGTVVFSNSNNVSFGINASTITATATMAQTNQQGSVYASSNTFGTSSGTYDARTLSIAGSGAVSVAASNSGWVVSAPAQTNQSGNLYVASNTFGTSSGTYDARTLSIRGSGAISVAASNSGWVISAALQTLESNTIGVSNVTAGGGTGGTTGMVSGAQIQYLLVPGSNITMSQSTNGASGTISIYAPAAGAAAITQSLGLSTETAGGGTGGTTGYVTGDDILYHFVPGSNITMSQSINGSSGTLSIYGPAAGGGNTLWFYDHAQPLVATVGLQPMASTSYIQPVHLHNAYSWGFLRFPISMSAISTTFSVSGGAGSFTASNVSTCYVVIYSKGTGASSMSLRSVASGSGAWTHLKSVTMNTSSTNTQRPYSVSNYFTYPYLGNTSSWSSSTTGSGVSISILTNLMSNMHGPRLADLIPFSQSLPAQAYWMAIGWSSDTGSQSFSALTGGRVTVAHMALSQVNTAFGFAGDATNSSVQPQVGIGSMTTNAIGTTASYPLANISSSVSHPIIAFQGISF